MLGTREGTTTDSGNRRWAGCPQALQGRKCDPHESKTRIWLLDDGTAEVSLGAEVSPSRRRDHQVLIISRLQCEPVCITKSCKSRRNLTLCFRMKARSHRLSTRPRGKDGLAKPEEHCRLYQIVRLYMKSEIDVTATHNRVIPLHHLQPRPARLPRSPPKTSHTS